MAVLRVGGTEAEGVPLARAPAARVHVEYALFDYLRFALASWVMFSHSGLFEWEYSGRLAVEVFFALSGWLIGGILYDSEPRYLSRFYFDRSTRIWIPYFFCVAALYLVSFFHEAHRSARWLEFLSYDLTFTHYWLSWLPTTDAALRAMPLQASGNHFWSLATEEQFYLGAPLLMTLIPFGRTIAFWVLAAAIAYFTQTEYAAISFGVLAAVVFKKFPAAHTSAIGTTLLLLDAIGSVIALSLGAGFAYASPLFGIAIVLLVARPMPRSAVSHWLGGVSFPFYLNAWMGGFALHAIEKHVQVRHSWLQVPLVYFAGLGAGVITYHLIDRPVMANRRRWYSVRLGWILGAIGYSLVFTGCALWWFVWREP